MIDDAKNKVGRPTYFKEEYVELAYKYCLLGATDKDLAQFFEVTETTINNWKNDHPEFFESIKKGKKYMIEVRWIIVVHQRFANFIHNLNA